MRNNAINNSQRTKQINNKNIARIEMHTIPIDYDEFKCDYDLNQTTYKSNKLTYKHIKITVITFMKILKQTLTSV